MNSVTMEQVAATGDECAARKILVLTGKRGGFGAMKPMLRILRDEPAFELQLVVTDQHVNARFGNTIREVEQEFEVAAAVDMEQANDEALERAQAVGRCTERMAATLADLRPDICLLYGDRGEVLAAATAASLLGLPIAHMQGGDVSGSLDEHIRHAVTKLSHLHFPSTEESAARIRRMGEEDWRIHVVGDNHLDGIIAGEYMPVEEVMRHLDIDPSRPAMIVLQHSETTEPHLSYEHMIETLTAVSASGYQAVVIHPCSDQGYEGVLKAIREVAVAPQFKVHVNLDAHVFWGLMKAATVLVGNSSAGLIETPVFRLPSINIGRRQEGRLRAENVIDVVHDRVKIAAAIERAVSDEGFRGSVANCTQPYGDGRAGERIIEVIRHTPVDRRLLVKRMTY